MVTRVASYMSNQVMVGRMKDVQARLFDTQVQVATEKKSQTYKGISSDAMRLVNFENQHTQLERYRKNNALAEVRLQTMGTSLEGVQDTLKEFRRELIELSQQTIDQDDDQALEDIQTRAFATLQNVQHFLNIDVAGRHVFSGGKTSTPPISFPYGSLDEFQAKYDGNTVTYPATQAANLFGNSFDDKTLTPDDTTGFTDPDDATKPLASLTGAAGDFVTRTLTDSDFGNLTLSRPTSSEPDYVIQSNTPGAFSTLTIGTTLLFDGGGVADADYQHAYRVMEISADGKSIKVQPPEGTAAPANATTSVASGNGAELRVTVPDGATVEVTNGTTTNTYTVRWPAGGSLTGDTLYVRPDSLETDFGAVATQLSVTTESYYKGDTLVSEHRVDDSRSIEIGINARDPAFEKAFRALGVLAQGQPLDTNGDLDTATMTARIDEALTLLNDAFEHQPNVRENKSDLATLERAIANSQKLVKTAQTDQRDTMAYLEARMADMENVDMMDAVTRLNDDARALEVSYNVLARVSKLSLSGYI